MANNTFVERLASCQINEINGQRARACTEEIAEGREQASSVRCVRFTKSNSVELILTKEDYSRREKRACWYTPEEKEKMESKREKTIERLDAGKAPKRGRTYRGLECCSEKGQRELHHAVLTCIDAVMDEQERQWDEGKDDYDKIAVISMQTTALSKLLAWEKAHRDAEAAAEEEIEDVSSSETGSDHAFGDIPVPVLKKERWRSEKNNKNHTKKGRKKRAKMTGRRDGSSDDGKPTKGSSSDKLSASTLKLKDSPIRVQVTSSMKRETATHAASHHHWVLRPYNIPS